MLHAVYPSTFPAQNRLLAALPAVERARLDRFIEHVAMPQYFSLARSGEPLRDVWFSDGAVASAVVPTPEGAFVEAGLLGSEALIGVEALHGARRSTLTVLVEIPGYGARMRADDFRREVVAPRGALYRLAMRYTAAFQFSVAQTAACNARHNAGNRLARSLLMAHDRVAGDEIRVTQDFLAQMLGARRATVTQAASDLRRAGAIDYYRGRIIVADRARLQAMACGCYSVMKRETEGVFT